ncbi:MAG: MBL fold metallo-hydrolase [Akkermansiaceae bacterium]
MKIHTYMGGLVGTNAYLLETSAGILAFDAPADLSIYLQQNEITAEALLLTHQHFDHVEDVAKLGLKTYAHSPSSADLILDQRARDWGLPITVSTYEVDHLLEGKTELQLCDLKIDLIHVPGHSPDSVCFHFPEEKILIAGDTLFAGGVGCTDLPHGEHELLMSGIREKLYLLPDDTTVYPGHGPATTIGQEKRSNPFI